MSTGVGGTVVVTLVGARVVGGTASLEVGTVVTGSSVGDWKVVGTCDVG
jgi:hypothetical protein